MPCPRAGPTLNPTCESHLSRCRGAHRSDRPSVPSRCRRRLRASRPPDEPPDLNPERRAVRFGTCRVASPCPRRVPIDPCRRLVSESSAGVGRSRCSSRPPTAREHLSRNPIPATGCCARPSCPLTSTVNRFREPDAVTVAGDTRSTRPTPIGLVLHGFRSFTGPTTAPVPRRSAARHHPPPACSWRSGRRPRTARAAWLSGSCPIRAF